MQANAFWQYSLIVYNRDGVAPLLLQLQDNFGADVNLLLCCCWLAAEGKVFTAKDLQLMIQLSAKWRAECIIPLRGLRKFLSTQPGVESMASRVKALELESEQWQQDLLYRWIASVDLATSNQPADMLMVQGLQQYCALLPGVNEKDVAELLSQLVVAVAP